MVSLANMIDISLKLEVLLKAKGSHIGKWNISTLQVNFAFHLKETILMQNPHLMELR